MSKKHEYDKVLALAQEWSEQTKGDGLILMGEGDDLGIFATGSYSGIASMLHTAAEDNRDFAEILVEVAGNLIKDMVVDLARRKEAMKQAYEETRKAS